MQYTHASTGCAFFWAYIGLLHWGSLVERLDRRQCILLPHEANGKYIGVIASDNGLSPCWRQAIIWNNAWILLTGPLGTNVSEILIAIHIFSFTKMHFKMSSGKWWPFCLGLNVLTQQNTTKHKLFPYFFGCSLCIVGTLGNENAKTIVFYLHLHSTLSSASVKLWLPYIVNYCLLAL